VGKYTSPHLVDFRERVLIDGVPVAEIEIVAFIERWTPTIERIGATFFEATTAMAFDIFARAHVDVAVIETGLGGRLDATNVLMPVAAGVTSIGIDHVEYLGDTKEQIAVEKAGIFKPGVPAVIGETDDAIAGLLAHLATERGAHPTLSVARECAPHAISVGAEGTRFSITYGGRAITLVTPLAGRHQAWNASLALLMLEAANRSWAPSADDAARRLARVRLPGRFQRDGRFIFDVAHNTDGAAVLARTLLEVAPPRPVAVVLCVLGDKDWQGVMRALAPAVDRFVLTDAPTAPDSRAWSAARAGEFAASNGWQVMLERDFDRALGIAADAAETVLVTGSFHTVGDAMTRLPVDPLAG
jgi:dihydrofolate synthase/folylpolyglutamate synthase